MYDVLVLTEPATTCLDASKYCKKKEFKTFKVRVH